MPNWCSTQYRFHGDNEELEKFYAFVMHAIDENREDNKRSDFKSAWLGNILFDIGEDRETVLHATDDEYRCRGWITDYDIDVCEDPVKSTVSICTETAWDAMPDMWDLTLRKLGLNTIKYSFIAEEEGGGYFIKCNAPGYNDFLEEVSIDAWCDSNDIPEKELIEIENLRDYCSKEEAVKTLNEFFGTEGKSFEELQELIDKYNEEYSGEDYRQIRVNEYEEYALMNGVRVRIFHSR